MLVGDETDTHRLALTRALTQALVRAGFTTVGRARRRDASDLSSLSGVGAKKVALVVQALQRFLDAAAGVAEAVTLDRAWEHATAPLQGQQKQVLERISSACTSARSPRWSFRASFRPRSPPFWLLRQRGLATLDRRALDEIVDYLEGQLISAGGILRIDEAAQRLLERWPAMDGFGVRGSSA